MFIFSISSPIPVITAACEMFKKCKMITNATVGFPMTLSQGLSMAAHFDSTALTNCCHSSSLLNEDIYAKDHIWEMDQDHEKVKM